MRGVTLFAVILTCACREIPTDVQFEYFDVDDALLGADADGVDGNGETIGND